jgi:PAS domain S-box-containing protein
MATKTPTLDYQQLFQFLPERFMVFRTDDPDFTLVDTNRLHAKMAMVDHDTVVGQPFFEVFPDTSEKFIKTGVSDLRESMRRVIATGQPDTMQDFRYDIRQPDGSFVERWWRPTHYPLNDSDGKLSFIIQVSHDVTEEVHNQRKLAQAQRQLDEALAIGQVGSWIWDIAKNNLIADKNLALFFGVSPEEAAAGIPLEVFTNSIHPDDRPQVLEEINETVTTTGVYNAEYRTIDSAGRVRWVLARGRIEYDDTGAAARFPGVLVDITERKQLEQQLREANEKLESRVKQRTRQLEATNQSLERSNRELQDFAYVASHDLQEPLRKIQAFGNLLESEYGNRIGDGQDYLNRMRNAASRMSILIEDLLAFSRVTTKARPFTAVDLQQICTEVIGDLETRIADTHATVTVDALPTVLADALQMRQLLQNLIANALKFQQPGKAPQVTIRSEPITDKNGTLKAYHIEVADNGIGFDEKYLDRIFAVFQRLHGHEAYEGTGIGLAVCRKIAERHGGTITAKSTPGKGATFIVALPVKPPKETR